MKHVHGNPGDLVPKIFVNSVGHRTSEVRPGGAFRSV